MTDSSQVGQLAARLAHGIAEAVVGAEHLSFALTIALLARGHALIEGVPGTGKTLAVRAFAYSLGLEFRRIQFTPDLMPSDIVGTTVFDPRTAEFSVHAGPIVANVVLADEINRTPPKTQAALLEAMEEGRVTLDGLPIDLPDPFMVCATQNPVEYEGTYPLPEAQLDRFLVKVETGYPSEADEARLLERVAAGFDARSLGASNVTVIANLAEIRQAQATVRRVHVARAVARYAQRIVTATRDHARLALGASPRAGVSLLLATQAAAAMDSRDFATPDDVKDVAALVLAHRFILRSEAEIEGVRATQILADILAATPVPRE